MKSMERMVGSGKIVQSSIYKQTKKIGFNEPKNSSWVVGRGEEAILVNSLIKILEA